MTNTLSVLIKAAREAGYQKLFAKVRKENISSQKVLINNHFIKDTLWQEDPTRYRFIRDIAK